MNYSLTASRIIALNTGSGLLPFCCALLLCVCVCVFFLGRRLVAAATGDTHYKNNDPTKQNKKPKRRRKWLVFFSSRFCCCCRCCCCCCCCCCWWWWWWCWCFFFGRRRYRTAAEGGLSLPAVAVVDVVNSFPFVRGAPNSRTGHHQHPPKVRGLGKAVESLYHHVVRSSRPPARPRPPPPSSSSSAKPAPPDENKLPRSPSLARYLLRRNSRKWLYAEFNVGTHPPPPTTTETKKKIYGSVIGGRRPPLHALINKVVDLVIFGGFLSFRYAMNDLRGQWRYRFDEPRSLLTNGRGYRFLFFFRFPWKDLDRFEPHRRGLFNFFFLSRSPSFDG